MITFLYVIGGEDPPYKIGIATDLRMSVEFSSREKAIGSENKIHSALGANRKSGEWFDYPLGEIEQCIASLGLVCVSYPIIHPKSGSIARHNRVRSWRRSRALSREALAELSGFSESVIRGFENGYRRGQKPEHTQIQEAAWRRYGLALAAIDAGLKPLV